MGIDASSLPKWAQEQIARKIAEEDGEKAKRKKASLLPNASGNKYHAQKTSTVLADGSEHVFDSKKEAERGEELSFMERAGEISNLRMQVEYELIPSQKLSNGKTERGVKYVADFVYEKDGKTVVEDVKGYRNSSASAYGIFVIKRKLMLWKYGLEIMEV